MKPSPSRLVLAVVLALGVSPLVPSAAADTYPRQPGVDIVHYVFRLQVGDQSDEIVGEASILVRIKAPVPPDVTFDLTSAASGKGMTVQSVSGPGGPMSFTHERDRLRVTLPAVAAGQEIPVTVTYRGVPGAGLNIGPNKYGERTFFSENWPNNARQWLPTLDHPGDKATGEFIVTAPAHYQVIAAGLLVEEMDLPGGLRRTHWKQSVPIPCWLFSLGVARFAVRNAEPVGGVPLASWVYPQDRETGYAAFEEPARRAVSFFSERIGPYPYEKLANVEGAGFGGGMEHATAIFYGEKSITGRPIVSLVAHEIAHQWFGDCVTESDWDDVWLSEGFATYLTLLYTEHYDGRDAFVAGLVRARETVRSAEKRSPDTPIVHRNLADMSRVLNSFVYQKGGWVLHMLRRLVGEESFARGLLTYYRRYRNQNATTDDFREVMEQASGRPLAAFFRQWLNRPGIPAIEGTWQYNAATRKVEVELVQTQAGDPFEFPLEVGVVPATGQAVRVEKVDVTGRRQRIEFPADAAPLDLVLDPDTWLLMEAPRITRR